MGTYIPPDIDAYRFISEYDEANQVGSKHCANLSHFYDLPVLVLAFKRQPLEVVLTR